MATVLYDRDANMKVLEGKTVAVLGYGSQGHAHAQNLRDSGVSVVVGLHEGSKSRATAERDGFTVHSVGDAVKKIGRRRLPLSDFLNTFGLRPEDLLTDSE